MQAQPNVSGPVLRLALGNGSPYRDEVWTTLDGRRLRVGQMDEQHVRQALRLMLKRRREFVETYRYRKD